MALSTKVPHEDVVSTSTSSTAHLWQHTHLHKVIGISGYKICNRALVHGGFCVRSFSSKAKTSKRYDRYEVRCLVHFWWEELKMSYWMPFDICHMAWWRRVTLAKRMEAGAGWMCERIKPFGRHDEQVGWSVLLSVLKQLYNRDSARQKLFRMMALGRNLQITSILVDLYSCIYIVVPATPSHQSQLVTVTAGRKLRPTCEVCEKVESRYREELSAEIFSRICQG